MLEHCTIPRTGALDVIMSVLGPSGTSPPYSHITKVPYLLFKTIFQKLPSSHAPYNNYADIVLG